MYTVYAVVVLLSLSSLLQQVAPWTQQYGDASSTNFVNYRGLAHVGWKYTTPPYVSQTSPSVSEDGVIFYPQVVDVVAIAPNGTILWKCNVTHDEKTYLTNTVYSEQHGLVVVGAEWKKFDVVAVHGGNGTIAWKSTHDGLFDATTISISLEADAVYIAGHENGTLIALRLKDGKILWKKGNIFDVGIFMQTKVGPAFSISHNSTKQNIIVPTDPYDGIGGNGNLVSYDVSEPGNKYWNGTSIGFSAGGLFAFSNQGMIFGRDGGSGGPQSQQMFGLSSQNGTVMFNGPSYCQATWSQVSGPAVDVEGYAYYK